MTLALPTALLAAQLALTAGHARPVEAADDEPKQVLITFSITDVLPVAAVAELHHYIAHTHVQPQGNLGGPLVTIGAGVQYAYLNEPGYRSLAEEPPIPRTSPRVLVLDGQEAYVQIGSPVSYLEATGVTVGVEVFRVVEVEGVTRGLTFAAQPAVLDSGAIRFESLDITITEVVGRLNIVDGSGEDLGIPGGRPITRSVTYSVPVTLPEGQEALVQFETPGPEPQIVLLKVAAEVVEPEAE